jgi:hypothetical protein
MDSQGHELRLREQARINKYLSGRCDTRRNRRVEVANQLLRPLMETPRPKLPTVVPGIKSPTVPSPVKSERKISPVVLLEPAAGLGA